ncbi:MAG: putative ABC transporter permease [Oscillospiraceae bacterium]|nr:putative ABC transporter permease [Oscillospiraceae bacterium]
MGIPLSQLFLYFILYAFLGWVMETCYCSVVERRLVARGFLYGPICPIYGGGVTLMILFFTPLKGNLILFYGVAVVVMTSWEYLVGWVLEVTTHVKYWDYSQFRFNLKGRVCLWVALTWGVLSYIVIFFIHPPFQQLVEDLPVWLEFMLCGAFLALLAVDAAFTIRNLVLVAMHVESVTQLGQELQLQAALGKAELSDKLADSADALRQRYSDQVAQLEKYSRRFRHIYRSLKVSQKYSVSHKDILAAAALAKEELLRYKDALKSRVRR